MENLALSIAASINGDMAKGRAALQAKAQGGLGDMLAGGNSALFDARLNLLASFMNVAKMKKRIYNAIAGDVGDAVGRDIEGRVNQGQAADKAAEITLGDYFAIAAHHADSAEYALVSEFAERMLGENKISAKKAAEEMLDAWIARNKEGEVKAEGGQVLEQQDTTAAAAMFEKKPDVSRETPPKEPKKPPKSEQKGKKGIPEGWKQEGIYETKQQSHGEEGDFHAAVRDEGALGGQQFWSVEAGITNQPGQKDRPLWAAYFIESKEEAYRIGDEWTAGRVVPENHIWGDGEKIDNKSYASGKMPRFVYGKGQLSPPPPDAVPPKAGGDAPGGETRCRD